MPAVVSALSFLLHVTFEGRCVHAEVLVWKIGCRCLWWIRTLQQGRRPSIFFVLLTLILGLLCGIGLSLICYDRCVQKACGLTVWVWEPFKYSHRVASTATHILLLYRVTINTMLTGLPSSFASGLLIRFLRFSFTTGINLISSYVCFMLQP